MRQHTAAPAPVIETHGSITIQVSRPVDGGYAINVFAASGGHRHDQLCFTTPDRETAIVAFRTIRAGGQQGVHPDGIHAALRGVLTNALHVARRRRDTPSRNRVEYINRVLDQIETPADAAALAGIAETLRRQDAERTGQPTTRDGRPLSGWGQLKADFATTHQGA